MPSRITVWLLLFAALFSILGSQLTAQPPLDERNRHEFLLLDIDVAATKKFATVQNHLRVGQLVEAVELLRGIHDGQTGKLVAAGPGRYVNWRTYANMLAAALPPEGLKIYRAQFDPLLRPTFEAGRNNLDEQALLKVTEQGFCCTFADEALLLLGDMAWDDGDIWRARSYWQQLLPPLQPTERGEPVMLLAYPDSDVDRNLVLGRLALCGIQAGRLDVARRILTRLDEQRPPAVGHLGGKTGPIREIVENAIQEAQRAPAPLRSSLFETFGGHPRRFDRVQQSRDIGTVRWQVPLRPIGNEAKRGFIRAGVGSACYFPVVYGDMLLLNDNEDIYAYRLETGEPVWPAEDKSAKIFSVVDLDPEAINAEFGERTTENIGQSYFTMTVADGRLYARLGAQHPLGGDRGGVLVCLDLAHRDGKLIWNQFATNIELGDADWHFEGSPLVVGNRVYVGLRRANPQPQSNVACFDAVTGKLLWNRKLCVGSANPHISDFDVNQHLLTWGDGTLYYATHMGAIAALEPHSGTIKWLVSYPRVEDAKFRYELDLRLRRGPLPAMFAAGTLYVAPLDSNELLAIEAETGVVKWTRAFQTPVQSLLGVSQGLVYVSGAQLWAVSAQSGQIVWPQAGDREPDAAGFGRGLLVGDSIYWPNHDEILIVDQATGMVRSRFPLTSVHGQSGGNLLLIDGYLAVAQPDRLAVFANLPELRRQLQPGRKLPPDASPAGRAWQLGRIEAVENNWTAAADLFQAVQKQSRPQDEWLDRPLSRVAAEREFEMRLHIARSALETGKRDNEEAAGLLQKAVDIAPDRARRSLGLVLAVQWLTEFESDSFFRFAKQLLTDPRSHMFRLQSEQEHRPKLRDWISDLMHQRGPADGVGRPVSSQPQKIPDQWTKLAAGNDVDQLLTAIRTDPGRQAVAIPVLEEVSNRLLRKNPNLAEPLFRELLRIAYTDEERARGWSGLAQVHEARKSWRLAEREWRQAGSLIEPKSLVPVAGQREPIGRLLQLRLCEESFSRERERDPNFDLPWPLTRRWTRAFDAECRMLAPGGDAPSLDLECLLVDQSPVLCVNPLDGSVRWQCQLSRPLEWAAYFDEMVLLATTHDVRAVSILKGEPVWLRSLQTRTTSFTVTQAAFVTATNSDRDGSKTRRIAVCDTPQLSSTDGLLSDFVVTSNLLVVRHGLHRIVAWRADTGEPAWNWESDLSLAPGLVSTEHQILSSSISPPSIVGLDHMTGAKIGQWKNEFAAWSAAPIVREDHTLLSVGRLGQIASWATAASQWNRDEGQLAWNWKGTLTQSHQPPQVLSRGEISLLVIDGDTLIAAKSSDGSMIWKIGLGRNLVEDAAATLCFDKDRVYVPADGILRAYSLTTGKTEWECSIGPPNQAWKSRLVGDSIVVYPARSQPASTSALTICQASSGQFQQRLAFDHPVSQQKAADLNLIPTGPALLFACGETVVGLGAP
jgi:outer membrane protein assembly factor BamB